MANPENKQIPYESTQKDIRDAIESVATAIGGIAIPSADHVSYDNSGSGLSATDVQNALDEIVSDIPTVNDGTLTIQQNGETKGTFTANQSGNSTVNIETPTTDIQTAVDEFETYNGGILDSLKVALSPNQDLHGYDSPWVGGAGKNLFNPTALTTTTDGVTFTNNGNGTYTLNGTATADIDFSIESFSVPTPNVQYKMVGCPSGLSSNAFLQIRGTSWYDNENGSIATTGDTSVHPVQIRVKNGATFNNVVFKPMFSLDTTITYDDFEPYENICPISSHTEVDIYNVGKNLFDEIMVLGDINGGTGREQSSSQYLRSGYIRVDTTETYYIRTASTIRKWIYSYDKNKEYLGQNTVIRGNTNIGFTLPQNTGYIRFLIAVEDYGSSTYQNDICINISDASFNGQYVPYNGYQVTVNLGGTYYSGTLDVVSGVLTATRASEIITAMDYYGTYGDDNAPLFFKDLTNSYRMYISTDIDTYKPISNAYKAWGANLSLSMPNNCFRTQGANPTNRLYFRDDRFSSKTQIDAWLANNPVQVCGFLATPTPIQLSPTMVKALVGENHLSAPLDGQEITESKYKQMFTFDDVIAYIQSLS